MKKARGFTLLELMIVVAIVAILAALAITSYGKQVRKSKRAEAKQVLADWAVRQEKYRSNNASYATCDQLLSPGTCANFNSSNVYKNYTFAVTAQSATGFTMTAVPKTSDQAKDACGTLSVQMQTGTLVKCPSSTNLCASQTPADCW
jgi:type IV pilus assembly protein PilE